MITIKDTAKNVIAFQLSGTVEKADIKALEKTFKDKMEGKESLGLYMDINGLSDMTGDAIAEDIKFEMSLVTQLNRFARIAIVSNKKFVEAGLKFANPFLPTIEMKVFAPGDAAKAMDFVTAIPTAKAA